jgi:EAL domain-containing protein (putative c-di-GMP-specific phosphodiesterase class I)
VKIDRSFVTQLDTGDAGRTIVAASVAMAHGLGLRVVAEGIETDRQLQTLRALGCDDGQGYLFGRPAAPERVTEFCREWPARGEHTLAGIPRPGIARSAVGDEAITA